MYYIAIDKLIKESPYGYYYRIISHSQTGIKVCEHSKTKGKNKDEFDISFDELTEGMDGQTYSIEGTIYENDRDKSLLLQEIQCCRLSIQLEELKKYHEAAIAGWAAQEVMYKEAIQTLEASIK